MNCENCGATIGKLEVANVWNDQPVCATCYKRLAASGTAAAQSPAVVMKRTVDAVAGRVIVILLALGFALFGLWVLLAH